MFCKVSSSFKHRTTLAISFVNASNTGVVVMIEEEEAFTISFKKDSKQFLTIISLLFSLLLSNDNDACFAIRKYV